MKISLPVAIPFGTMRLRKGKTFPLQPQHRMDKQNLLTIGSLSKQTGVHIKSLRYYEQLGILLPAYTDPDSGYRYYTLSQIPVVDAIRACIFLDIPLKEFSNFLTQDGKKIHYRKLISYGSMLANRKIREIQEKLNLLKKFRKQIDRMEGFQNDETHTVHTLPEKYCWAVPYSGKQRSPEYNIAINRLFEDISRHGLRLGAEAGLLSFRRNTGTEQFMYVEVEMPKRDGKSWKEIIRIPAASFLCTVRHDSGMEKAPFIFPELFAQEYDQIIMETELFSGDYDFAHPKFELRCSLPGDVL